MKALTLTELLMYAITIYVYLHLHHSPAFFIVGYLLFAVRAHFKSSPVRLSAQ